MELALPTILAILGIIPGIAFFYSYYAKPFSRSISGVSPIEEVAIYVTLAFPLGVLGTWIATTYFLPLSPGD